jgi:hypothetical protein
VKRTLLLLTVPVIVVAVLSVTAGEIFFKHASLSWFFEWPDFVGARKLALAMMALSVALGTAPAFAVRGGSNGPSGSGSPVRITCWVPEVPEAGSCPARIGSSREALTKKYSLVLLSRPDHAR